MNSWLFTVSITISPGVNARPESSAAWASADNCAAWPLMCSSGLNKACIASPGGCTDCAAVTVTGPVCRPRAVAALARFSAFSNVATSFSEMP